MVNKYLIIFALLFLFNGCATVSIPLDRKCKVINLAGDTWASNDLTSMLTFNEDCSGVIQKCNAYFTYEMLDFGTVYINVNTTSTPSEPSSRMNCPKTKGVYKCVYSLTHLTESNIEVIDISCAWNNYRMEQLTRYEK